MQRMAMEEEINSLHKTKQQKMVAENEFTKRKKAENIGKWVKTRGNYLSKLFSPIVKNTTTRALTALAIDQIVKQYTLLRKKNSY